MFISRLSELVHVYQKTDWFRLNVYQSADWVRLNVVIMKDYFFIICLPVDRLVYVSLFTSRRNGLGYMFTSRLIFHIV